MSVPYNTLIAETALRINAIAGTLSATLNTNYAVSPLTTTEVVSSIFPLVAIQDSILDAEGRLAQAIADNVLHPWRQYMAATTAALANVATLPAQTSTAVPIVGAWGAVVDSLSSQICSEMPLDEVRRRVGNNAALAYAVHWYAIAGGRIEHTRVSVVIECCGYSRSAQRTALNANGNILLPDALANAYVAGAVAALVRDDEFLQQSQVYATYFLNVLSAIGQGVTTVTPASYITAEAQQAA